MTPQQLVAAYEKYGSLKAVSRKTKTSWGVVHSLYEQALAEGLMEKLPRGAKRRDHIVAQAKGKVKAKKPRVYGRRRAIRAVPLERSASGVSRFLFTCAQNNTKLHEATWENILAMKEYYEAELHISRFAYVKSGLGARGDKANYFAARGSDNKDDIWFDERIVPYISDDRRQVAPGLVWVGDANILPTAARPLSGFETLTGRQSGIFPHVKIAMQSIPSALLDPTKFNYTTGTITQRNYIHRKEGLKADFHHCYGALLVEVENETGDWWCRQINADSEGTLYDLDICIKKGKVERVKPQATFVEGIKWGDVHEIQMDPRVRKSAWGEGGMLDYLRPRFQFLDDVLDFLARNHHEIDDPLTMFQRYIEGKDNVRREVASAADFFLTARRPFTHTVVTNSNHDRALLTWLKNKRGQYDPVNVEFWHAMNNRVFNATRRDKVPPIIFKEAYLEVTGAVKPPSDLQFLAQDESFIICPKNGGIECGQHGDDGPNGSRGTTLAFTRMGRKMNKDHDHIAAIFDHVYSAGCCLNLEKPPAYVHGPSSWSNSHTITYVNGKRQIITMWGPDRAPWAARPEKLARK